MYNKRQYRKYNDKKVLHKVGKRWKVISLALLMTIGGFSVASHSIKAYADNGANTINAQKSVPNASAQQLKSTYNKFTNPSSNNNGTSNNNNSKKMVINSPLMSTSQDNNQSQSQETTPSVSDIVTAINNNNWNQQYGSKYSDLLSKLNYNDIHILDNPTAYNNYANGNNNVTKISEYENNLSSIQQDLSAFSGYSKVRSTRNLMNLVASVPSLYSFPLFNGYETSFTGNDSNNYNDILTSFSNLEFDHNNNDKQITDLKNALASFNKLSNNAQNSVSNFYGIQPSDINNEITNLRNHATSQGMQYQPIKLVFYDISSQPDSNSSSEQYAHSRTPVGSVILNESDFGNSNPETMVDNPNYSEQSAIDNPIWIPNSKLQVPSGYTWDGLVSPVGENTPMPAVQLPPTSEYNGNHNYKMVPKQQLHFHLVPASEAGQPEEVDAYVNKAYSNTYTITNEMENLKSGGYITYSPDRNTGVYFKFNDGTLEIGGDFGDFTNENGNDLENNHVYDELIPNVIKNYMNINQIKVIKLDDSVNLMGNCSHMFSDMPNLQKVISNGNFDIRYYNNEDYNNRPSDMSYMFANDPKLTDIEGLSNWNVSDVTNMNSMFYGDKSLSDFTPIKHWDTGSVNNMDSAFANSGANTNSLNDLNELDLRALTSAQSLFAGDNYINDLSPWNSVQMGEGQEPNVSNMFKDTGISNDDTPTLYKTENGNYTIAPTSNVQYLHDSKDNITGIFYKDGSLVLEEGHENEDESEIIPSLPSSPISQWVQQYGIDPSTIRSINIEGQLSVPGNSKHDSTINKDYIDLNNYFANLTNLQTIDLSSNSNIYNNWSSSLYGSYLTNTNYLFANDPNLNNVIGFFGNEQALKNTPAAGNQSAGLIDKNNSNGSTFSKNIMSSNISTAHMFDGDSRLFTGDNAQANVDAISSIPMNNVHDAGYMFNSTGLSDSNIVTDWDLSNLQNASHMFAGCNLSNLNGFNRLGNWTVTISTIDSSKDTDDKDIINKVVPTQLQNASYMFANNPHLDDISGISGNNIDINPITNISDMFNGDTNLKDVSYIEDGNNNWDFTQKPNVTGMFDKTGVGYSTPEVSQRNSKYILESAPEIDTVYFAGDLNNNTNRIAEQGTKGANKTVVAPNGYHFSDNTSSKSFTFNGSEHTFNVSPNQYNETINYQVQNNDNYAKHGQVLGHLIKQLTDNQTDANNIKFTVDNNDDSNIPSGYHLVNNSTIVGNHQSNTAHTDTVWIAPNSASFTVNFMHNTKKVGSKIYKGLVDNSITVNGKNVDANGDVPYNYAINNGQLTNFTYNADSSKNVANIQVSPQNTSETIDYVYNNGTKSFNEGSNVFDGTYNTTGHLSNGNTSAQATGLKAGWQISNNPSWTYNDGSKAISVKPISASAIVNYVDNNSNVLGSHTFDGNDSRAIDAGNNSVDVNKSDEPGMPAGYHLSSNSNTVNFDGHTYSVLVSPNTYTETINYVVDDNDQYAKKNENLGFYTTTLNDENDSKAGNTSLDISNGDTPNIPKGYQLVKSDDIKHQANKNYTDKVLIKPKYVTNYVSFNGDTTSNKVSVKGYYDSNMVINNPKDYHFTGTKQVTLGANGSIQSLNVTKNVIYIKFNGDTSANTSRTTGDSATVSAPSNYHFTDGKSTEPISFIQNGKTFTFDVKKNTDTDHINFNGDSSADTTKQGTDGTKGTVNAPNGYHYIKGSNGQFTFDGGTHTFDVDSNTHTVKIAFNGDSSADTTRSGNYQSNSDVSAPSNYHFTDGKSSEPISFSQNGKTFTFNVAKNAPKTDTDHINFNGDSSANTTLNGTNGTQGNVNAPQGYHFSDNKSSESFTFNGSTHVFNVLKNAVVPPISPNRPSGPSKSNIPSQSDNNGTGDSVTPNIPSTPSSYVVPTPVYSSVSKSKPSVIVNAPNFGTHRIYMTNKGYPIQYNYHNNHHDVVTYYGYGYPVHYHDNGKNTIHVNTHGNHYHNVVVSLNLPTPHIDAQTTHIIDMINFKQHGKRIFTRWGLFKAINNAKIGEILNYHGQKFTAIRVPDHFRFFMVRKNSRVIAFGKNNSRLILKPDHLLTIHINRIFVVHGNRANYVRYEIQLHHHNYWVAGRNDFVPNSYLQPNDFTAHKSRVRLINGCRLYSSYHYNKQTFVKTLHRGDILHVKKVIFLGNKDSYQTRLVLTNGDYVTANKNYVEIY